MTSEGVRQEIDRDPYVPWRLHLSSGKPVDLPYTGMGWLRQNTLLVVYRLDPRTSLIGNYDVIALRAIERIEQLPEPAGV